MIIQAALYAYLSTESGVAAIASTRGYPVFIPLDADLPAWSYQVFEYPAPLAHDTTEGLETCRVQITCTATTYLVAVNLARAIRAALHGYTGTMGGVGGVTIHYLHCDTLMDGYNFETTKHTVRVDAYIEYTE